MSTALSTTAKSGVPTLSAPRPGTVLASFTPEDREIVRAQKCADASDAELNYFLSVTGAMGLNPLTNDAHLLITETKSRQGQVISRKVNVHIGIDGFRKRAMSSRTIHAIEQHYFSVSANDWVQVVPNQADLLAARVKVHLHGWTLPIEVVVHWEEFGLPNARYYDDGNPKNNWAKMPRWMLQKVALSNALRSACPDLLGGVYTTDELGAEEIGGFSVSVTDETGKKQTRTVPRPGNAPATTAPATVSTPAAPTEGEIVEGEVSEADPDADAKAAKIESIKALFPQVFPGDSSEGVNWELVMAYCANLDGAGKLGRKYPMLKEWSLSELTVLETAMADEWAKRQLEPEPEPTVDQAEPEQQTETTPPAQSRELYEEQQAAAADGLGDPEVPEASF